jgi:hypothetical protein
MFHQPDRNIVPNEVSYRFNSSTKTCAYAEGEDCLTAAVKDVMSWSVPEYIRTIPLPSEEDEVSVFRVELYGPDAIDEKPHYCATLRIPHSIDNLVVDANSALRRGASAASTHIREYRNPGSLF